MYRLVQVTLPNINKMVLKISIFTVKRDLKHLQIHHSINDTKIGLPALLYKLKSTGINNNHNPLFKNTISMKQ